MTSVALSPGSVFAGDFEIVRPLTTGGMGSVYIALQKSTGKQRALKLMLAQLVSDPELRRRFDQEARIASLVESEHVVEVVAAGVDEASGAPWLAMELLEGTDLDRAVTQRGPLSLAETRRIMEQLCHAVGAAHAVGIVHRDLKPENVFLAAAKTATGGSTTVKVLDFGIAKLTVDARTKETSALGTPIWMAPEQTERGKVTPAADVWPLGLIAFFLLTGRPFWRSANDPEAGMQPLMREILFDRIPTASVRVEQLGLSGQLPRGFDEWFARCVVRDVLARFADARELFSAFAAMCERTSDPSLRVLVVPQGATGANPRLGEGKSLVSGPTSAAVPSVAAPRSTRARDGGARPKRIARPSIVLAGLAVLGLGAFAAVDAVKAKKSEPRIEAAPPNDPFAIPRELADTRGAAWFRQARGSCNPVQVEIFMRQSPPPDGKDGAGFGAACYALAGKNDHARALLDMLPRDQRSYGAYVVFEVVHPVADAGDDASAGAAMRLVLAYWPDNYMAAYHAGIAEFRTGHLNQARHHLHRFQALYKKQDGFTQTATKVLAEIDAPTLDCNVPIAKDPEGHAIYAARCTAPAKVAPRHSGG